MTDFSGMALCAMALCALALHMPGSPLTWKEFLAQLKAKALQGLKFKVTVRCNGTTSKMQPMIDGMRLNDVILGLLCAEYLAMSLARLSLLLVVLGPEVEGGASWGSGWG